MAQLAATPLYPSSVPSAFSVRSRRPTTCRTTLVVKAGFFSGRWVLSDKENSQRYELLGKRIVLGRKAQDGVDVVIDNGSISGMHVELSISTNSINVKDLKSTNGTAVNGRGVGRGGQALLRSGDTLELGDVELLVTCEREAPVEQKTPKPKAEEEARPPIRTGGLAPEDIKLGTVVAAGSFGTVFRGEWKGQPVILKQANLRVESAAQLLMTEYQLNERVAREAPGACADFIGALEVGKVEAGATYAGKLTEGLWLAWKEQGVDTLESYLEKSTFGNDIALALGVEGLAEMDEEEVERAAVVTVMRQLFERLAALHKVGIVHRDVKPSNMLIDVAKKEIRLIDLGGAAACLGEPISYEAGQGAYDPLYAPPELYLIPAGSPRPNSAIAPMLWKTHSPELFDTFSAGRVMLRLAVPSLRSAKAIKGFQTDFEACGSLGEWRDRHGSASGSDEILSGRGGAGWNLVSRLTAEPKSAKGGRMTALEALAHPFLKL